MDRGQEHEWHIELDYMRAELVHVLNNIDDLHKRNDLKDKLKDVIALLHELCNVTKGESK